MNKKAVYEIDFKGKDSASSVASKIVSTINSTQGATASTIRKVTSELQGQAQAAAAMAAQNKAAFEAVAAGAGSAATDLKTLTRQYEQLKQQRAEAAAAGDGKKIYDLDGQIRQLGFQINQTKKLQVETQAQQKSAQELSSAYTQAYNQVKADLESGAESAAGFSQQIELQKKKVADLSAQYQQLKTDKSSAGEASTLLQELNNERGALAGMRDAVRQYESSNVSLRTRIAAVRNEMAKMRLEGKENTAEYEELRREMERLGTAYRELQTEQNALSTGATQIGGIINGVQGLMGVYSAGSGIVSMFVKDNEKLMQVQTKMQSVMAVMMGIQQASNTLHATSAFRIVTCRKVTELWTAAQTRLTVSLGISTVAAKAFMATLTLGASLIVTGVITAISKLIDKKQEQRKKTEEARKAEEDAQKSIRASVANSIGAQLLSYRKLQREWKSLNGNLQKQRKFIKDNAGEFQNLGVKITTARDAENLLIDNESALINSFKKKAIAAAAMEAASKKYQEAIENMLAAEDAKKITEDDRKKASNAAYDRYLGWMGSGSVLERGQRSQESVKKNYVNQQYREILPTYGQERAKPLNEAADASLAEAERIFTTASRLQGEADKALQDIGVQLANGSGSGSVAGSVDAIEKKIQALQERMKSAGANERAELQKQINAWQKKLDAVNLELEALGVPADPQTIQDLETAISYYNKLLKVAGAEEREEIQRTIDGYQRKKTAIEDSLKAVSVPTNPKTLEEYSQVISSLQKQLEKASASEQQTIQVILNAYKREEDEMRARIALASTPAVLDSLADYEDAISACEAVLQYANADERAQIQKTINEYRRKKQAIEESLDALDIPAEPKSLEDYDKVISALETKIQKAGESERAEIQAQIDAYKRKKEAIEESLQLVGMDDLASLVAGGLGVGSELELTLKARITGAEIAKQKIQELQKMAAVAQTDAEKASIKSAIKQWRQYAVAFSDTQTQGQKTVGMLENMSTIANSLSGVVDDNASGWLSWGANVLSAVAAALPAIASVIGGQIAQAFAGATAQSQSVPFPYNLIALAASLTAVGAAVASIPKYAEGGIAYGTTVGIFGEYPGAQHNPEVVAPLDKLKALIGPQEGGGIVRFRIEGRTLVGILEKENQKAVRTH